MKRLLCKQLWKELLKIMYRLNNLFSLTIPGLHWLFQISPDYSRFPLTIPSLHWLFQVSPDYSRFPLTIPNFPWLFRFPWLFQVPLIIPAFPWFLVKMPYFSGFPGSAWALQATSHSNSKMSSSVNHDLKSSSFYIYFHFLIVLKV